MFLKRSKIMVTVCFGIFLLLGVRLMFICLVNGASYEAMAHNQQQCQTAVKSIRGNITDRNGVSFTDRTSVDISITPDGSVTSNPQNPLYTFSLKKRSSRIASHITGYTGADGSGLAGAEKVFDPVLKSRGSINLRYASNATGAPLDSFEIFKIEDGKKTEVRLTLDYHIQKIAEEVMDNYIKRGAVVILDTQNFDILAMASRPDFDGENIEKYKNSTNGELLNRALCAYNAGSVFKIATASAALEKDAGFATRYFDCRGRYDIAGANSFACNNKDGHGILSFDDAFALSCNCCFYVTGLDTGAANIMDMAKKFGIGERLLNINLEENIGNLPQRTAYTEAETLNLSIGQGEILITPLQCAVLAATVANDGIRKDVNIVSGLTKDDGSFESMKSQNTYRVIKSSTARHLAEMMRECVLYGTGANISGSKISIAGKTGSAETGWVENGTPLVHGWFCGFFPYETPRYAMAILSEGGLSGAGSCIQPFAQIAEKINEIYPFK